MAVSDLTNDTRAQDMGDRLSQVQVFVIVSLHRVTSISDRILRTYISREALSPMLRGIILITSMSVATNVRNEYPSMIHLSYR